MANATQIIPDFLINLAEMRTCAGREGAIAAAWQKTAAEIVERRRKSNAKVDKAKGVRREG